MAAYQTAQRKEIFALLSLHPHKKFTAKEMASCLSNASVSLSAIYRNLSALEKMHLIYRTSLPGSREMCYQYLQGDQCKGQVHLSCTGCGTVSHLTPESAEFMLKSLEMQEGFQLNPTQTILYGLCKECQSS